MIRLEETCAVDNPGPRASQESNNHLAIHACRPQQVASRHPPGHFIPQLYDRQELADLVSEPVFILKGIPAVLDHYLRQLAVEIMTADPESIGQDIDAVEGMNPSEINPAVGEDLFRL